MGCAGLAQQWGVLTTNPAMPAVASCFGLWSLRTLHHHLALVVMMSSNGVHHLFVTSTSDILHWFMPAQPWSRVADQALSPTQFLTKSNRRTLLWTSCRIATPVRINYF